MNTTKPTTTAKPRSTRATDAPEAQLDCACDPGSFSQYNCPAHTGLGHCNSRHPKEYKANPTQPQPIPKSEINAIFNKASLEAYASSWRTRASEAEEELDKVQAHTEALANVCERFSDFSFTDYEAKFNTTAALGKLVMLKRAARLALADYKGVKQ